MKENREDINIRNLFRQKLENAEIVPDASVRNQLMRKLGRREFLRFNPGRFNVYYLGTIVTAALVTALIINAGSGGDRDREIAPPLPAERIIPDVTLNLTGAEKSQATGKTGETGEKVSQEGISGISTDNSQDIRQLSRNNITPVADPVVTEQAKITRYEAPRSVPGGKIVADTDRAGSNLQIINIPGKALFVPTVTSGCIPLKVQFRNYSASSASPRWSFGDGGYSGERDPEWIYDIEGEYKVTLNIVYEDGRKELSSAIINAYPKPVAHFEIIQGDPANPDHEVRFINYSINAVKYFWEFGDGQTSEVFEPYHKYARPGNYNIKLTVYSESGCQDSQTVINAFSGSGSFIEFPNAFIPNPGGPTGGHYSYTSDLTASVFHPVFSEVTEYQLRIFSKRGILIFESNDINIGWDGYLNGQLCEPGVYIWKVRGRFRNGESFTRLGDLTLLRNQ